MSLDDEKPRGRSDAIVDSRLYVRHHMEDADLRNRTFFAVPANRAHLASQLLVYEHVIIPTNDFGLVPAFINWMGLKHFEEALDNDTFSFLRRRGFLGYGANGLGIQEFGISDTPEKPFSLWWQKALYGDLAQAVELQLLHGVPSLIKKDRERLLGKVVGGSKVVDFSDVDFFVKNIAHESYFDVRDTPELRDFMAHLAFSVGHPPGQPIDIARLPGVGRSEIQIAGDAAVRGPADLVLRVAETNMEIVLADYAGGTDLHVSRGAEMILRHKMLRAGSPPAKLQGFTRLLELNGIPDIRTAVESGSLALPEIWKVRQSRRGKSFRKWLARADAKTAHELERLYVESLEETALVESLPVRAMRFILTTGIGFVNPVAGVGAGVIDTFFTEKYLKGYRPKLMFEGLRKLFPAGSQAAEAPKRSV